MKLLSILFGFLLLSGVAQARDEFDAVKCDSDIPKALIGKTMSDDPAMKSEIAHKAIGLQFVGAEEVSDKLQVVGSMICGATYQLLIDNDGHIYDVLPFPTHSRATPEFSGTCQRGGKDVPGFIYAVLDNKTGFDPDPTHHSSAGAPLPALAAWRIDEKHRTFVPEPIAGLFCPRAGIFTVEGGL